MALHGTVSDEEGNPIPYATVSIVYSSRGAVANAQGAYNLTFTQVDSLVLRCSAVGFSPVLVRLDIDQRVEYVKDFILSAKTSALEEVEIISSNRRFGNIERIEHRGIGFLPDASGSFESILKALPGVSSSHELSSQYSVRGGNFDENLVYVNDVEIFRPFLVRSGQQEGLTFINSNMVDGVEFSAGGFNAEYGDKMSSVLKVKYKKPSQNSAQAEASLLGGSALVEGIGAKGRFTHLTGVRYKTTGYMLSSLDEGGDYAPNFVDAQTNLAYRISPKLSVSFLGNLSLNSYEFVPRERETRFGFFTNALQLKVFYQGQEANRFKTAQGATIAEYRPTENSMLKFVGSYYSTVETETFDVIGQYFLNELDRTLGSSTYGDSLINVGIGGFHNHARNFLYANFYRLEHLGQLIVENHTAKWGVQYQLENIDYTINEWEAIDSSGFMVSKDDGALNVAYALHSSDVISASRVSGYLQTNSTFHWGIGYFTTTAGVRLSYWGFNQQLLFSPRIAFMLKPHWRGDVAFHLSGGAYHQPPLYKELQLPNGQVNKSIKAQESYHAVFGVEYLFKAWNRPFRFQTELYYKYLDNLIPYKIDNVRVLYAGENLAKGFVQGVDFKINGEFVSGAESWASISLMKTEEDIKGDSFLENGQIVYPGYYPRPTDQRFSIGLFFQDFIPGNDSYKVHLTGFYGSGLPFNNPLSERYDFVNRMPSYKRVDIGFTKILKDENISSLRFLNEKTYLKHLWIGFEIFNLFDFKNTISYMWVQTVANQSMVSGQYAVPNYLTSRRFNVKISARF